MKIHKNESGAARGYRDMLRRLMRFTAGFICACISLFGQTTTPPLSGERVLWLGDSITQAGDYVTLTEYLLEKKYPANNLDIISIGLSSETASCLSENDHPFPRPCVQERLQRALDLLKPQVVIACYGMNDGIYHPQNAERMAAFERGIHRLIAAAKASGARVILLTPTPFDRVPVTGLRDAHAPDFSYKAPFERYDDVLADYSAWEKKLPAAEATVVDLHTPIDAYLAERRKTESKFSFTKDGIHPDLAGHLLMARTLIQGLGVALPAGDLTAQVAQIQADPLYALVKSARETRSLGWLDYVGYTRDKTVKKDSVDQVEQKASAIQIEIDRLRRTPAR
jgi:lysophospholipase L1-like esterase